MKNEPVKPPTKRKRGQVNLPPELAKKVRMAAAKHDLTIKAIVEEAVRQYLVALKKPPVGN